jgi:hypothetical protein
MAEYPSQPSTSSDKPRSFPGRFRPSARFSLRALLIAFTALALSLGWYSNRVFEQRQTVQMILSRGGVVRYDFEGSSGKSLSPGSFVPTWLRDWLGVDWFHSVIAADLNGIAPATEITDGDLQKLSRLAGLKKLVLRDTSRVTPLGIEHLARASSLEDLYLHRPAIRGSDLAPLRRLKHLTHLKLFATVGDEGLAEIGQFAVLTDLELPVDGLTADGIRELKENLRSLKRLELLGVSPAIGPFKHDILGLGPPSQPWRAQWTFP